MAHERVLVVGAGGISNAWFPNLKHEQLDVVGVVDLRREAAQGQIDKYQLKGAVAFDSLDAALQQVKADFAIDLTIPDAHCEVTTKCLRAGLHVIGEKPMAATLDQARQMQKASEESGKLFMVSQSRRWDGKHASVAATVKTGALGTLTTVTCDFYLACHFGGFRDEMESPLILDMAIHHFDLLRMFTGLDAVSVYCEESNPKGSWYNGDVAAECMFELTGGVRFNFRGSWASEGCHTSWNGDWRIIGTDGTLIYAADQDPRGQVVADRSRPAFNLPLRELPIEKVSVTKTAMHGALMEMLTYLREGTRPQTECHDNIKSLAMVLAAIKSSREKRRVRIDEC